VVLDAAALPLVVQEWLARPPKRANEDVTSVAPSIIPAAMVVVSLRRNIAELLEQGRITRSLASRLRQSVELPTLSSRTEDIRSMVLERLAAWGMRRRGEPLGIAPSALAMLIEHEWPGNDAELTDVLVRATEVAEGQLVTAADLAAIGFHASAPIPPVPKLPATPPESRRRRSRAVGRSRGS